MDMWFEIPGKLPSLNEYIDKSRTSRYVGARLKKRTDDMICWSIKKAVQEGHLRHTDEPLSVRIKWCETNRKRDLDNIFSAHKFIFDALQRMDIIDGDGQKYIREIRDDFHISDTECIRVTFERFADD